MYLSKLCIMAACCMGVYGTENSTAQQHDQPAVSSEQRIDSVVPILQYIDIYRQLICKDLDELKGILNSISAPVTNRDEEEKISLFFERNVENIGALITQMEKDMRFATAVTENAGAIQNEFMEMKKAIDSCVNILDKLGEKQFLSNDFINAVKMKMILLSPHVYDPTNNFKPNDIFRHEYMDFFQDKSYPYLLRGYFALYKAQDRKEAKKLFEKSTELGNEEGRVMSALCDQPKVRELMDKVQNTLDRINVLVPQIIDQQTAITHEREFVTLFDSLYFTVKQLNRSHLSPEDTVYAQSTWVPAYSKLMAQFFNEWKRIWAAQYFGSDKLKSSITGKSVELNMYFDIGTIIQGIYNQAAHGGWEATAQKRDLTKASVQKQHEKTISPSRYVEIYVDLTCREYEKLRDVLNSVTDPLSGKKQEEEIASLFVMCLKSMRHFYQKFEKEPSLLHSQAVQNALNGMLQKHREYVFMLENLAKRQFLDEEYVRMVKTRTAILSIPEYDQEDVFAQEYVNSFQNKSYPYLLQGFLTMYKTRDMNKAKKLFQQSAQLGNKEARVMEALCDEPKARDLMTKIQHLFDRLNTLAPQIINKKTANALEDEFVSLFNDLDFHVKMLNRLNFDAQDSVYIIHTWSPIFMKSLSKLLEEWQRIRGSEYYGSRKLGTSVSGKSITLNAILDFETMVQEHHAQSLDQKQ